MRKSWSPHKTETASAAVRGVTCTESEGEEMPSAAARAELESLLVPYLEDPANVFRLSWQPNDLAIWRNRRLLHTSTPWAQYTQERRLFHLMFLDSDRPILAP
eukprot:scaffold868_cov305-Prasinococcus_capsulatus_cf.AAC.3